MKRILAAGLVVIVLGAIVFLGYRIYQMVTAKQAIAERIATLPAFELTSLDGRSVRHHDLSPEKPVVLVFFGTTCPFCQSEAKSIRRHEALRAAAQVLMISHEREAVLTPFVKEHGFHQETGVQVLRDAEGKMAAAFGVSTVPNTFIYDADRRLLQHFKGEASSEAIYRTLFGVEADTSALIRVRTDSCEAEAALATNSTECARVP